MGCARHPRRGGHTQSLKKHESSRGASRSGSLRTAAGEQRSFPWSWRAWRAERNSGFGRGKMVKLAEWFLTGQKSGKIHFFYVCGFITSSVSSRHRWGRPAPGRLRSQPGWRSSGLRRWPSAALSERKHRRTSNTRETPRGCQTSVPQSNWSVTVKSLLKSSWVRKRRSASCRSSAGRPHSSVWRAFMAASPPSTVRNCFNTLALHTRSFSCVWAPARETWNGPEFFSC